MEENTPVVVEAEEVLLNHPQADYFGVDEIHRFMLPDNTSWVEHRTMNEGDRRKFLSKTNKNVKLDKRGDATIQVAPGEDRVALLEAALTGWNLTRGGKDISFTPATLSEFLRSANPKIVDLVEADIRNKNEWLSNNVTIEAIDEEIESLKEQREEILQRETGNGIS